MPQLVSQPNDQLFEIQDLSSSDLNNCAVILLGSLKIIGHWTSVTHPEDDCQGSYLSDDTALSHDKGSSIRRLSFLFPLRCLPRPTAAGGTLFDLHLSVAGDTVTAAGGTATL